MEDNRYTITIKDEIENREVAKLSTSRLISSLDMGTVICGKFEERDLLAYLLSTIEHVLLRVVQNRRNVPTSKHTLKTFQDLDEKLDKNTAEEYKKDLIKLMHDIDGTVCLAIEDIDENQTIIQIQDSNRSTLKEIITSFGLVACDGYGASLFMTKDKNGEHDDIENKLVFLANVVMTYLSKIRASMEKKESIEEFSKKLDKADKDTYDMLQTVLHWYYKNTKESIKYYNIEKRLENGEKYVFDEEAYHNNLLNEMSSAANNLMDKLLNNESDDEDDDYDDPTESKFFS